MKPTATPAQLGYRLPAEWEPHEATWLAWPQEPTDWPGKFRLIEWVYAEIVRKIAPGEKVRILVGSAEVERRARRVLRDAHADLGQVEFFRRKTNRSWLRDAGPIFLSRRLSQNRPTVQPKVASRLTDGKSTPQIPGAKPSLSVTEPLANEACTITEQLSLSGVGSVSGPPKLQADLAIVQLHFNGWAKYRNWRLDRQVPVWAAKTLGLPLFEARIGNRPFVLEGGGIETNGQGTLITTEQCYLDPKVQVRNPGLDGPGFEQAVRDWLAVRQVIWLGRGIAGDDTHGHVDDLCRFVNPTTVVLVQCDDPNDENYLPLAENAERLQDARLADGSKLEVVRLPMPQPLYFRQERLPASYANFYIANAAVLVPTFNDPADRIALGILAELFPDRPVVGIHAVDLVLGLGTIHCLSQQQPASNLVC
ncbi:MAG: agmatine deiminase family protein [Thermoguttaceae bacterium]|nr:agmatine deiminase family protein [Thermoguttaceae bacterium]